MGCKPIPLPNAQHYLSSAFAGRIGNRSSLAIRSPRPILNKNGGHMSEEKQIGPSAADQAAYWKSTLRLTLSLLTIWFLASFGAGILFREALDNFSIGGAPLGFWMAQNGAIYIFLLLIIIYCIRMTQLEKKYGIKG